MSGHYEERKSSFEQKKQEAIDTRNRIVAARARKSGMSAPSYAYDEDDDDDGDYEGDLVRIIENGRKSPEQWKERRTLLEYDMLDLQAIDSFNLDRDTDPTDPYCIEDDTVVEDLLFSLKEAQKHNLGYLKDAERSFYHAGSEGGDITVQIGKIEDLICIIGDTNKRIIVSPLFDTLLKVTNEYIDFSYEGHRLRMMAGAYASTSSAPLGHRSFALSGSREFPTSLKYGKSVRISILEPNTNPTEVVMYEDAPIEAAIEDNEITAVEEYPAHEAHLTFEGVQNEIMQHFAKLHPSHELVEQLRDLDRAISLPPATIDNQSYTITLRTSPSADVIFFHNSSIRTNQDRVADVMGNMSVSDFLELATNDELRESLLHDTVSERGFYLIRQHDGEVMLMNRDAQESATLTADSPYFMAVLRKAEDKLAEYFAALEDQGPSGVPLRMQRMKLAEEIEAGIPKAVKTRRTIASWLLDWLNS